VAVGTTTAEVAILTEKVVNGLFLTRVKVLALMVLAVGVLGGVLALAANALNKVPDPPAKRPAPKQPAVPEPKKPVAPDPKQPVAKPVDAVRDELAKFQGTWVTKVAEKDGLRFASPTTWVIEGKSMVHKARDGSVLDDWLIDLLPKAQPKIFYAKVASGPSKDKFLTGIYRLDGDTLEFCRDTAAGFPRPKGFSTTKGSGHLLFVLERQGGKTKTKGGS
jgi:uncharacterized protein (TIGR03067 family)